MSVCRLSGIHNIHLSVSHRTSVCASVIHDVCLSVCHPSVTHDVRPSHTISCPSITHDVRLSVRPSPNVCLSVRHTMSVRLSHMMSVCPSITHDVRLYVRPSLTMSVCRLSGTHDIHLCVSHMMSVCPSVRLSYTMSVCHS